MRVQIATLDDIPAWLELASEVENLFGPMVNNTLFHQSLRSSIGENNAFCVRYRDRKPGNPLLGGLLFSAEPPVYRIGWLAVAKEWRRRGVGALLVRHAISLVKPPAELHVTTFSEDDLSGRPAVQFYRRLGFRSTGTSSVRAPSGINCETYRLIIK